MNIKLSVIEERMPEAFRAFSRETSADKYTIMINEDIPELEKAAEFLHEMLHIWHGDYNSNMTSDQIERIRHAELKEILGILLQR